MNKELDSLLIYNDGKTPTRQNEFVSCSFCQKEFPSSTAIGEHLIICGNRTDQCPTCKRFIRRAVFAYHFENNCANLDDTIGSDESRSNSINNRNKTHNQKSEQTKMQNIIRCEFCNGECCQEDYDIHKEKCLHNPKTIRNKQRKQDIANSNKNSSLVHQYNNDIVYIPCQFCNQPIESHILKDHQIVCNEQQKLLEEQKRSTNRKSIGQDRCQYCKKSCNNTQELHIHQTNCSENSRDRSNAADAPIGLRPLYSI